jgi:hypothetical protein
MVDIMEDPLQKKNIIQVPSSAVMKGNYAADMPHIKASL